MSKEKFDTRAILNTLTKIQNKIKSKIDFLSKKPIGIQVDAEITVLEKANDGIFEAVENLKDYMNRKNWDLEE